MSGVLLFEYQISTPRANFYNITPKVREAIAKSGVANRNSKILLTG